MATQGAGAEPFREGDVLAGYRVVERVGRGGMGDVYRAWDDRLQRPVAIKAARPVAAFDDLARKRFLRETRMACRVNHPFVATVYDVLEESDQLYLVMEFIEGRRLDEIIDEDHPKVDTLSGYAVEIAEALAAIHSEGIVHRDLKPANVMVTRAGHVKVMDFGVARPPPGSLTSTEIDATLTREGYAVGTVNYMSPEQVGGKRLDARSDLFSLGIVLWEAITGEHPFARSGSLATASAIVNEPPGHGSEPRTLTASGPMRTVVLKLLEKDPDRRYASADELAVDIRAVLRGEPLPSLREVRDEKPRRWIAAVLALSVVLAALTGLALWRRAAPGGGGAGGQPARPVVAVLPFEDRTGDDEGDLRGRMVADLLGASLGEDRAVRPMGSERVEEILASVPPASRRTAGRRAIEQTASLGWTVFGTLYKEGDEFQAAVEVYVPGGVTPLGAFKAAAADTATLVDVTRARLAAILVPDIPRNAGPAPSSQRLTSASEEARLLDERARTALREMRYLDAIGFLEKAVAIDPNFVAAQARLAEALDGAGFGRRAREAADRAKRMVEGPGGPPSERIGLEVRAACARIRGDFAGEVDARRALAERYSDEPEVQKRLGGALVRNAKFGEALPAADRALSLDPSDPSSALLRARVLFYLRRAEDAETALRDAKAKAHAIGSDAGEAEADILQGHIARELHSDLRGAAVFYRAAADRLRRAGLAARAAQADRSAADTEVYLGNFASADSLYRSAIAAARAEGEFRLVVDVLNGQGSTLLQRGEVPPAEALLRQALEEARRLENPDLVFSVSLNLASLLQSDGRVDEGRAYAERGLEIARQRSDRRGEITALLILADTAYQQGRTRDALQAYGDVVQTMTATSEAKERLGFAEAGLAQVLDTLGRTEAALAAADKAVERMRALEMNVDLGYYLVIRAGVRAQLALWDDAEKDLAEADAVSKAQGRSLEDLAARVNLIRGTAALMRGRENEAGRRFQDARSVGAKLGTVGLEVPALIASCRLARSFHQDADAAVFCRDALERPRGMSFERVEARAALAGCLAATGRNDEAEKEARLALQDAERMDLPRIVAEAAGVLVGLSGAGKDTTLFREQGRRALDAYFGAAPKDRRDAMRARADLSNTVKALDFER